MFLKGESVGVIQPYFLSQIDRSFDRRNRIDDPDNLDDVNAQAEKTAEVLAGFIGQAKARLDICIYDFRLPDGRIQEAVVGAINDAAERGVAVRIAYDEDQELKTPGTIEDFLGAAADPAPDGTNAFVESDRFHSAVQRKPISTEGVDPQHHIMHQKYILRDALTSQASLLMGSANFTLDAWAAQENNILVVERVPDLVQLYANDFGEMWATQKIGTTGVGDSGRFTLDGRSDVHVSFAPGEGKEVEGLIAQTIADASRRLYVASMVISSGKILRSILNSMMDVEDFGGIYDAGFMTSVEHEWEKFAAKHSRQPSRPSKAKRDAFTSAQKLELWEQLKPHLVGKHSIKYSDDAPHNFMHDKVAVADDTVVTGSFNFSNDAMKNAENILVIRNPAIADQYVKYIEGLLQRYGRE
jgi:phosphatidylserine/phosphatidylglycerophosphate/cardiolipin synthase-like enzyme